MFKKLTIMVAVLLIAAFTLTACQKNEEKKETSQTESNTNEDNNAKEENTEEENTDSKEESNLGSIEVVSREDGSGTRGAFVEITGIKEEKDGKKVDNTYAEAVIQKSTNAVMLTVSGDVNAIGYISLGSLNDSVKALKIEGVDATAENVQNKSYKISRPFNICWKSGLGELPQDFIDFMMSKQGQEIVNDNKLVEAHADAPEYESKGLTGQITIGGSTSVTPVMEKLAEAYKELNDGVEIAINSNGSSAGIRATIEGAVDIGMASRGLKDEEASEVEHEAIAIDGIAVVVNNDNSTEDITLEQVKQIFTGEIKAWSDL